MGQIPQMCAMSEFSVAYDSVLNIFYVYTHYKSRYLARYCLSNQRHSLHEPCAEKRILLSSILS